MKSKIVTAILLIVLVLSFVKCKHIDTSIDRINFHYEHSLRIHYHKVDIEILSNNDSSIVKVKSFPMFDSLEWNYSKLDTSFTISNLRFKEIVESINKVPEDINIISEENIKNNTERIELDGSLWIIEFGNSASLKKYEIWSPDSETEERKLKEFIEASKLIVKTSSLNVDEILKE